MGGKVFHAPSAAQTYFFKAVMIQNGSFKKSYADKKFVQSCETLCENGWCNTTHDCEKCALAWAHKNAVRECQNPELQKKRYKRRLESKNALKPSKENASKKFYDRKGHRTEVLN